MDPDVTYREWLYGDDAVQAWIDLKDWLRRGGFEPNWTPEQRRTFMAWKPPYGSRSTYENPMRENPLSTAEKAKRHRAIIKYIMTKYPDVYPTPDGWAGPGWEAAKRDERTMMRQAGIGLDSRTMNPLSMSPSEIAIGVAVVAGVAALVYYATRPAAAAVTPAPAPTPLPPTPLPPTPVANGTGGGGGLKTFNVTDTDSGSIIALNKGDTLLVTLPLGAGITDYVRGQTGALLTEGAYTKGATTVTQPWIATALGSESVHYQGTNGSINLGPLITFIIAVN